MTIMSISTQPHENKKSVHSTAASKSKESASTLTLTILTFKKHGNNVFNQFHKLFQSPAPSDVQENVATL